jgi:hypothetical protein
MIDDGVVGWMYGWGSCAPVELVESMRQLDAEGWELIQVVPDEWIDEVGRARATSYRILYRKRRRCRR